MNVPSSCVCTLNVRTAPVPNEPCSFEAVGPTPSKLRGSFGNGALRTFSVKTDLDGTLTARLVSPTKAKMRLALYNAGTLVLRGTTIRYQICGERTLTLKVERISGRGAFTVNLSKP